MLVVPTRISVTSKLSNCFPSGVSSRAGRRRWSMALDDLAELVTAGGIDDAFGNETGRLRVPDRVVRAIEQRIGMHRGNVATNGELTAQIADHARHLHRHALRPARILLDQAIGGFVEEAALLFDQQQVAG